MISAVPDNLYHIDMKDLFIEMLDDFSNLTGRQTPELILEKVATMSCKAAVKGNHKLSLPEVDALMTELLTLENPFCCPHGRPTIISMSKYEIEKNLRGLFHETTCHSCRSHSRRENRFINKTCKNKRRRYFRGFDAGI